MKKDLTSTPTREDTDDEQNPAESGDEQVMDELAVEPMPREVNASDVVLDDTAPPDDLIGRASSTAEDLTSLFESNARAHLADGFVGSGDEDGDAISQNDGDDFPESASHPAGA